MEEKNIHIIIETDFGQVEARLFDDTPLHRDNFVNLIEEGFYDKQSFHRIVKDFMIQGGEVPTQQRFEEKQKDLYDYQIPSEIDYPKYFHKRGALAAARLADNINPKKESSPTQFYIVTGEIFSDSELNLLNKERFEKFKQTTLAKLNEENKDRVKEYYRNEEKDKLRELRSHLIEEADRIAEQKKDLILINQVQRDIYKTIGGTPYLDNEYTVFGEILTGWDVIDKIQETPVNQNECPKSTVKFNILIKK